MEYEGRNSEGKDVKDRGRGGRKDRRKECEEKDVMDRRREGRTEGRNVKERM